MKAAMFYGPGDVRIENVPEPEERDDAFILKVHKASICNGSDAAILAGRRDMSRNPKIKTPYIIGHEFSGEIVSVGRSVKGEYEIGDRVALWCQLGAFTEYIAVFPHRLHCVAKLPEAISYSEGSVMELLGSTMQRAEHIHIADVVAVIGAGPAGLFLAQIAKCAGALTTIVVDQYDFRLQLAKTVGADYVVRADQNPVEKIREYCGGVSAVIDASGADVVKTYVKAFRPTSQKNYIFYGVYDLGVTIDGWDLTYGGLRILQNAGTRGIGLGELFRRGITLVERGKIDVKSLITHHIPLGDVYEGIRMAEEQKDQCGKVVVDITDREF